METKVIEQLKYAYPVGYMQKRNIKYHHVLNEYINNGRSYHCSTLIKELGIVQTVKDEYPGYWVYSYPKSVYINERFTFVDTLIETLHVDHENKRVFINFELTQESCSSEY